MFHPARSRPSKACFLGIHFLFHLLVITLPADGIFVVLGNFAVVLQDSIIENKFKKLQLLKL